MVLFVPDRYKEKRGTILLTFWPKHQVWRTQFKIFKKELHLPSPFTKTGDLFWSDFPKFQGSANQRDWSK